jgi:Rnl2 family RNA ligase
MFRKYHSIENSYRDKFLQYSLDQYPELQNAVYIITEKVDGSCIQLVFEPNKVRKVASRNRVLKEGEDFFGILDVLKTEAIFDFSRRLDAFADKTNQTINLYGELYGPGIQRRVDYGSERSIAFFDVAINGDLLPAGLFLQFMDLHAYGQFTVPVLGVISGLQSALEFDVNLLSELKKVEGNIIEGVVIKPRDKVYRMHCGSIFYLKKKGERFAEKEQRVKVPRQQKEYRPEVIQMHEAFLGLINDNRLKSIFSKEGEIQEPKQIGKYIKLIIEDAKEEFWKDNTEELVPFNKDELKFVFNVGNIVVGLLKEYL